MRSSNYEEQIIEILLKNKIDFEREVTFSDFKSMRGGKPRFDFVVYNNNKIQYIIEVDGEQHFHFISKFFKNQSDFKYMQEADLRKNRYCLINNIPLYRIPYYEIKNIQNLEDIFKEKFLVKTRWHNHIIRRELE